MAVPLKGQDNARAECAIASRTMAYRKPEWLATCNITVEFTSRSERDVIVCCSQTRRVMRTVQFVHESGLAKKSAVCGRGVWQPLQLFSISSLGVTTCTSAVYSHCNARATRCAVIAEPGFPTRSKRCRLSAVCRLLLCGPDFELPKYTHCRHGSQEEEIQI